VAIATGQQASTRDGNSNFVLASQLKQRTVTASQQSGSSIVAALATKWATNGQTVQKQQSKQQSASGAPSAMALAIVQGKCCFANTVAVLSFGWQWVLTYVLDILFKFLQLPSTCCFTFLDEILVPCPSTTIHTSFAYVLPVVFICRIQYPTN